MALIPYVADVEKWKRHFINMAEKKRPSKKRFYTLSQAGGEEPKVELITPAAQTVARAKAAQKSINTPSTLQRVLKRKQK